MAGILTLANVVPVLPVQAQVAEWDDATMLHVAGDTFFLRSFVDSEVFKSPLVRTDLHRIGLQRSCAVVRAAVTLAVERNAQAFRPVLLQAMRKEIPAELRAGTAWSMFAGRVRPYEARIRREVGLDAAAIYTRTRALALSDIAQRVAAEPTTSAPWADIFQDWNLDDNMALQHACHLYSLAEPKAGKRIFDGFHQQKARGVEIPVGP